MAFLFLHVAHADMEFIDEEREMILKIISEAQLFTIQQEYGRLSDFERITVIQSYKANYYPDAAQKKEIIGQLKKLCKSDGEFDTMEKNMVLMLEKIL